MKNKLIPGKLYTIRLNAQTRLTAYTEDMKGSGNINVEIPDFFIQTRLSNKKSNPFFIEPLLLYTGKKITQFEMAKHKNLEAFLKGKGVAYKKTLPDKDPEYSSQEQVAKTYYEFLYDEEVIWICQDQLPWLEKVKTNS